jgi:Zinc finger, C2H2 type
LVYDTLSKKMAYALFSCDTCGAGFGKRSALKNHIRKVHQAEVPATFPGDRVETIKRDRNGEFKYSCGKHFSLPDSVRRHAKICYGDEVTMAATENADQEEWTRAAVDGAESDGNGDAEDTIGDLSYDFVGIYFSYRSADRV